MVFLNRFWGDHLLKCLMCFSFDGFIHHQWGFVHIWAIWVMVFIAFVCFFSLYVAFDSFLYGLYVFKCCFEGAVWCLIVFSNGCYWLSYDLHRVFDWFFVQKDGYGFYQLFWLLIQVLSSFLSCGLYELTFHNSCVYVSTYIYIYIYIYMCATYVSYGPFCGRESSYYFCCSSFACAMCLCTRYKTGVVDILISCISDFIRISLK